MTLVDTKKGSTQYHDISTDRCHNNSEHDKGTGTATGTVPLTFFEINGKMLRFNRAKIQEWLQNVASVTPVFKPAKQHGRRKKQYIPHGVTGVRFIGRIQ